MAFTDVTLRAEAVITRSGIKARRDAILADIRLVRAQLEQMDCRVHGLEVGGRLRRPGPSDLDGAKYATYNQIFSSSPDGKDGE